MQGSINCKKGVSGSDFEDLIRANYFLKKVNQLVDLSFANKLIERLIKVARAFLLNSTYE